MSTLGMGCRSAPSLRVDARVLDRITIENKLLLFDAENELNIAIDARDQVVDEIAQIKDDILRTAEKLDVARRDESAFAKKGESELARVAALRAKENGARREFLKARLTWSRERLAKERQKLIVARAKFELAKATLVKKNNVPGASKIELADFEAQVAKHERDVARADRYIEEEALAMKAREAAWEAAAKALQGATSGALGSRWLY